MIKLDIFELMKKRLPNILLTTLEGGNNTF